MSRSVRTKSLLSLYLVPMLFLISASDALCHPQKRNGNSLLLAAEPQNEHVYKNTEFGFQFDCPPNFLVGSFGADYEPTVKSAHKPAVLIEKRLADKQKLSAIQVGKTVIVVTPYKEKPDPNDKVLNDPAKKVKLGQWTVTKTTAGPWADGANYYVVRLDDNSVLSFLGPRRYVEDGLKGTETGYEKVIEGLIASMKMTK